MIPALRHCAAYAPGTPCFSEVVAKFGERVVGANGPLAQSATAACRCCVASRSWCLSGCIDRKQLGALVFGNPDRLAALNSIVWPHAIELAHSRLQSLAAAAPAPPLVGVVEAALLVESGWHREFDTVWAAFVPRGTAVSRLMARNGLSEAEAELRINAQMPAEERLRCADVVINTDQPVEGTREVVRHEWERLLVRIQGKST